MAKSPSTETPRFAKQARVVLKGSEKVAAENAVHVKATPSKSKVTVSVIVKRKEPLKINKRAGRANGPVRVSRDEYKKHHSADPDALNLVAAFAKEFSTEFGLAFESERRGGRDGRSYNSAIEVDVGKVDLAGLEHAFEQERFAQFRGGHSGVADRVRHLVKPHWRFSLEIFYHHATLSRASGGRSALRL